MFRTRIAVSAFLTGLTALSVRAGAQAVPAPHTIVIKLVEQPGPMPYAFSPANFTAERGDTLRFVQAAAVMHDVHFKSMPKGAKLCGAATSPYLSTKGQTYVIVVDQRFVPGKYEIVCDPHEMTGMHAFLDVENAPLHSGGQ